MSLSLAKRSSTTVATSKDSGISVASTAKEIKVHSYPSFEPTYCRVHAWWHVEGLQLPKRRGLHSSHSQPLPKLRRPRHRCAHTAHWKYMVRSQTRYASYRDIQRSLRKLPTGLFVASALWRQSFWKHNQAYRRLIWSMQRCVNWSVPRTTVCTARDLIVAS